MLPPFGLAQEVGEWYRHRRRDPARGTPMGFGLPSLDPAQVGGSDSRSPRELGRRQSGSLPVVDDGGAKRALAVLGGVVAPHAHSVKTLAGMRPHVDRGERIPTRLADPYCIFVICTAGYTVAVAVIVICLTPSYELAGNPAIEFAATPLTSKGAFVPMAHRPMQRLGNAAILWTSQAIPAIKERGGFRHVETKEEKDGGHRRCQRGTS